MNETKLIIYSKPPAEPSITVLPRGEDVLFRFLGIDAKRTSNGFELRAWRHRPIAYEAFTSPLHGTRTRTGKYSFAHKTRNREPCEYFEEEDFDDEELFGFQNDLQYTLPNVRELYVYL